MRLGISSGLRHDTPQEWAENMTKLGLSSVVFPVDSTADEKVIEEYENEAKKHNLLIAEVGIWRNAIAEDKATRRQAMDYSIAQLRLADKIGANCCVNVAGAFAGSRWDGAHALNFSQRAWDETVCMVREIIDTAKPVNTFFTLEPMPWMFPTGPEEYDRLINSVSREKFAVHMDIVNMINCPERYFFMDEFLEKTFNILGPKIRSCHLKDVMLGQEFTFLLRECACGEGILNIEKYVELAEKYNPDMPMIIEHLSDDESYIKSVGYVRNRLGS